MSLVGRDLVIGGPWKRCSIIIIRSVSGGGWMSIRGGGWRGGRVVVGWEWNFDLLGMRGMRGVGV